MNRLTSILITFAVCLIAAGAATSIVLSHTTAKRTAQAHSMPRLTPVVSSTPTPTHSPILSVKPTPTSTATPAPIVQRKAITNSFVHLRANKSTTSDIVADLQVGTTVILGNEETPQWQAVTFGSYSGYVWKTYLNY